MDLHKLPPGNHPSVFIPLLLLLLGSVFLLTIQQSIFLFAAAIGGALLLLYLVFQDFELNYFQLVVGLLFLALIPPALDMPGGIPDFRLEEFIIYGFFPLLLLSLHQYRGLKGYSKYFVLGYLAYLAWMIVSTIYGSLFLGVPTQLSDYFNYFTTAKYLIVFLVIYQIDFSKKQLRQLPYIILALMVLSGVLGLLQYYKIFGLHSILGPLYNPSRPYMAYQRLIGTFHNPNTYSFILTIAATITTCLLFYERRLRTRIYLVILLLFFIFLTLISGSRTGVGSLLIVLTSLLIYNSYIRGYNVLKFSAYLMLVLATTLGLITLISADLITRYISALEILTDPSLLMRFIVWYLNFQIFLESPIFGWGPAEAIHSTIVDNEYLLTARRYGIIGFSLNMLFYLIPVWAAFKTNRRGDTIYGVWSQIIIFSTLSFLIGNTTNPIFHSIQAMDYWIILIAIFFSAKTSEISEHDRIRRKLAAN